MISADRVEESVQALREAGFAVKKFRWSINLKVRSKVSVQISIEEIYREFPARSVPADIHGILMRVASLPDTLHGKILAYQDPERRASKRQKDLTDILRLIEAHPRLRKLLPAAVAKKIADVQRRGTHRWQGRIPAFPKHPVISVNVEDCLYLFARRPPKSKLSPL